MSQDLDFTIMISYMWSEGSVHQRKFCNRYLKPIMGNPDHHGNCTKIIGEKPRNVHRMSGRSEVTLKSGFYGVN